MLLTRAAALVCVVALIGLAACSETPRVDATRDASRLQIVSTTASVNPSTAQSNSYRPLWDSAFGSLVGYSDGDTSIVVLLASFAANSGADTTLDASPANGVKVDLFGRRGHVGSAILADLGKASDEEGCFEYSRGGLVGAPQASWNVALPVGAARGLVVEDLSELRGADSAALVDQILRLAGMIRHGDDSLWKDAKYMIEQGTRLKLSDAVVITGSLTWLRPNPEHWARDYFILGEAAGAGPDAEWRLAYAHPNLAVPKDTTAFRLDSEDEIGVSTAVETKSDSRPVLFLETRGNEVNGYAAIARKAPGVWAVSWNGPHEGGC